MSTKKKIEKRAEAIRAKISKYDTGEKWSDNKGNHYNIDRVPIDFARIVQDRDTSKEYIRGTLNDNNKR